ncbi:MAG: hypothetical protein JO149_05180 [Gammaproteobacteria bacterium]|nr:hypothetical protein [Gammaproteobacteria bacterium]
MDSRKKDNQFELLADETLLNIFSFFNSKQLIEVGSVSKKFKQISQQIYLQRHPLRDYTNPNFTILKDNENIFKHITVLTNSLVIGCDTVEIKILDIHSGNYVKIIPVPAELAGDIRGFAKLADEFVAVLYFDQIHILNYQTGELLKKIKLYAYKPQSMTLLSDSLLLIHYDLGKVNILNYETGIQVKTIQSHSYSSANCITKLIDGEFVSGHTDGKLRIWNYQTGKHINTLSSSTTDFKYTIQSVVALPDSLLVSGYADGHIKIWNTKKGKCVQTIYAEENDNFWANGKKLYLAKLSGKQLLYVDSGGKIEIWHYQNNIFVKIFSNSFNSVERNILACTVLHGDQILLSKKKIGLEMMSFPIMKELKIELEVEPVKKKCLVM